MGIESAEVILLALEDKYRYHVHRTTPHRIHRYGTGLSGGCYMLTAFSQFGKTVRESAWELTMMRPMRGSCQDKDTDIGEGPSLLVIPPTDKCLMSIDGHTAYSGTGISCSCRWSSQHNCPFWALWRCRCSTVLLPAAVVVLAKTYLHIYQSVFGVAHKPKLERINCIHYSI